MKQCNLVKIKAIRILLFICTILGFSSCKTIRRDISGLYYGTSNSFTQLNLNTKGTFDYLEVAHPIFIPSNGKWHIKNDTLILHSDSNFVSLFLRIQRPKEGAKTSYTFSLSDNRESSLLLPITNFSLMKDREDLVVSPELFSKYSNFISIDSSIVFDAIKIAPILYPAITVGKRQIEQDTLLSVDVVSPNPYFVNRQFLIVDNKLVEIDESLSQRKKLNFHR